MDAFKNHTGKVVPYDMPNVDTEPQRAATALRSSRRASSRRLLRSDRVMS